MKIKIDKLLEGTNFPEGMDILTQEGILIRDIISYNVIPGAIALSIPDKTLTLHDAFIHKGLDYQKAFDEHHMECIQFRCMYESRSVNTQHKQGLCHIRDKTIFVDAPLVGIIQRLNELGFTTTSSCQNGYSTTDTKSVVIAFKKDGKIRSILKGSKHTIIPSHYGHDLLCFDINDINLLLEKLK